MQENIGLSLLQCLLNSDGQGDLIANDHSAESERKYSTPTFENFSRKEIAIYTI